MQLKIVSVGDIIPKKMMVVIKVASKRYLIFPAYVSFGTLKSAVNHLPIAVNGIKFEIISDKANAIAKLIPKLAQSIVVKLIVSIPDSIFDWEVMAEAKHKKNETGMSHITLYTNVANLNFGVITKELYFI